MVYNSNVEMEIECLGTRRPQFRYCRCLRLCQLTHPSPYVYILLRERVSLANYAVELLGHRTIQVLYHLELDPDATDISNCGHQCHQCHHWSQSINLIPILGDS